MNRFSFFIEISLWKNSLAHRSVKGNNFNKNLMKGFCLEWGYSYGIYIDRAMSFCPFVCRAVAPNNGPHRRPVVALISTIGNDSLFLSLHFREMVVCRRSIPSPQVISWLPNLDDRRSWLNYSEVPNNMEMCAIPGLRVCPLSSIYWLVN